MFTTYTVEIQSVVSVHIHCLEYFSSVLLDLTERETNVLRTLLYAAYRDDHSEYKAHLQYIEHTSATRVQASFTQFW